MYLTNVLRDFVNLTIEVLYACHNGHFRQIRKAVNLPKHPCPDVFASLRAFILLGVSFLNRPRIPNT